MYQLSYSPHAVLKHFMLALIATPLILTIPLNQQIAEGHVFGIFVGAFYLIGPIGRWAMALALIGIVWFSCIRLLLILLGDGIAFATGPTGVTVQGVLGRQEFSWDELIAVELVIKKSRHRSFRYLRARAAVGGVERRLDVPTAVLSATDADLEIWVINARRVQNEARSSHRIRSGRIVLSNAVPRNGFGRKRDHHNR